MQQHSICVQKKGPVKQGPSLVSKLQHQGCASLTGDRSSWKTRQSDYDSQIGVPNVECKFDRLNGTVRVECRSLTIERIGCSGTCLEAKLRSISSAISRRYRDISGNVCVDVASQSGPSLFASSWCTKFDARFFNMLAAPWHRAHQDARIHTYIADGLIGRVP
jgi:hypothetical protein